MLWPARLLCVETEKNMPWRVIWLNVFQFTGSISVCHTKLSIRFTETISIRRPPVPTQQQQIAVTHHIPTKQNAQCVHQTLQIISIHEELSCLASPLLDRNLHGGEPICTRKLTCSYNAFLMREQLTLKQVLLDPYCTFACLHPRSCHIRRFQRATRSGCSQSARFLIKSELRNHIPPWRRKGVVGYSPRERES